MARHKERPCPGCGKIARRAENTLCFECSKKFEDYNRMSELYERAFGGSEKLVDYGYHESIPLPLSLGLKKGEPNTERFRNALSSLIDGISPICEGKNGLLLTSNVSHDGPSVYGTFPSTHSFKAYGCFSNRFSEFLTSLRVLVNDVFVQGERSGQNLLKQLNDGRISTKDFEDRKNRK